VYSTDFKVYQSDIDTTRVKVSGSGGDAGDKEGLLGSKVHLIGHAFQRAAELRRIVEALPKDDPRIPVFERLGLFVTIQPSVRMRCSNVRARIDFIKRELRMM
jgi:hypothetical protein